MATIEEQLAMDIEQDDRMVTIEAILIVYPELTVKDAFEMLDDPLALETLLIEIEKIPNSSIE